MVSLVKGDPYIKGILFYETKQLPRKSSSLELKISEINQDDSLRETSKNISNLTIYRFEPSKKTSDKPPKSRQTKRRSRKRNGGYPVRRTLTNTELKQIPHAVKIMHDHGVRPNWFISINPPEIAGQTPEQRKAQIQREISGLAKIFKYRGLNYLAISHWEYPTDRLLHCHLAVHVPKTLLNSVRRWIERDGIWDDKASGELHGVRRHARPYNRDLHLDYATKERKFQCEPAKWRQTEKNRFRPRAGRPFRGRRLGVSKDLKTLLESLNAI